MEIYGKANSSKIEVDNKKSFIIENISNEKEINENLKCLKKHFLFLALYGNI